MRGRRVDGEKREGERESEERREVRREGGKRLVERGREK